MHLHGRVLSTRKVVLLESLAQTSPAPFSPSSSASLLLFNRVYFGSHTHHVFRVSHIVPLSLFLSAYTRDKQEAGKLSTPIIVPWKTWGPTHSRMFFNNANAFTASHGLKVVNNGNILLDFNILDARKTAGVPIAARYRSDTSQGSGKPSASRHRITQYMKRVASKMVRARLAMQTKQRFHRQTEESSNSQLSFRTETSSLRMLLPPCHIERPR